ncbi:unnamed protein product [Albugo candida]|uniref:Uncharacterized protein n=1 Tax=Albugo candida TaxID=65357 RepID=A0A024FUB7_9STRA|nr:unnamed protein product [Albugo candida]CCI10753.1 unnamed protein product [Albugo candida]|eukprot:CCI10750.1 unnamed protein product [Albugo candida]
MTCSYCSYKSHPCSYKSQLEEIIMEQDISRVCNSAGFIQMDDIICNNLDCLCDVDRACVSLVVGCVKTLKPR